MPSPCFSISITISALGEVVLCAGASARSRYAVSSKLSTCFRVITLSMSRLGERNSSADSRRRTFSTRPSRSAIRWWSSRRLRTKFSKELSSLSWPTSTPCRTITRRLSAIASAANSRWARNSPPSVVTPGNATSSSAISTWSPTTASSAAPTSSPDFLRSASRR